MFFIVTALCQCPEAKTTEQADLEFQLIMALVYISFITFMFYNFVKGVGEGCFHGSNMVFMANGKQKRCDQIVKGDVVLLGNNETARVCCAAKILNTASNKINLLKFPCGLIITEYHPIKIKDWWTFPKNIATAIPFTDDFDAVYSFLLEKDDGSQVKSGLLIQGIECAPLGHNIKGNVIEHEFFGNFPAVRDALIAVNPEQYNNGLVEITHMQRGPDEHVCGFIYNP
jgi:hypothetical protein